MFEQNEHHGQVHLFLFIPENFASREMFAERKVKIINGHYLTNPASRDMSYQVNGSMT